MPGFRGGSHCRQPGRAFSLESPGFLKGGVLSSGFRAPLKRTWVDMTRVDMTGVDMTRVDMTGVDICKLGALVVGSL